VSEALEQRDRLVEALRVIKRHCRSNPCRSCVMAGHGRDAGCRLRQHPMHWPDGSVQAFFSGSKDLLPQDWLLILALIGQEEKRLGNLAKEVPDMAQLKKKVEAILYE